jgi:hypothetical protein
LPAEVGAFLPAGSPAARSAAFAGGAAASVRGLVSADDRGGLVAEPVSGSAVCAGDAFAGVRAAFAGAALVGAALIGAALIGAALIGAALVGAAFLAGCVVGLVDGDWFSPALIFATGGDAGGGATVDRFSG